MPSRHIRDGYLMIDHRAGEGVNEYRPAGKIIEMKTYTCAGCQRQIIMNPLRQRDRHYDPKNDSYLCDDCEVIRVANGGVIKTFNQIADEIIEAAARGRSLRNDEPSTRLGSPGPTRLG